MGAPRGAFRRRVFALLPSLPVPGTQSGDTRLLALLGMLARDWDVEVCLQFNDRRRVADPLPERVARGIRAVEATGARYCGCGRTAVLRRLASADYAFGLFEFHWSAREYLADFRRTQPGAAAIVDSVDVHYLRLARGQALGLHAGEDVATVRAHELAAYRSADAVLVVSAPDREVLRAEPGLPRLALVPNIVTARPRAEGPREPFAFFVGSFAHLPNEDGITWYVREVWPAVRARVPHARTVIAGSSPTPAVEALGSVPGIEFAGPVPDTAPWLDRAAVSVAPLRFGAGMKGKVSEAMAAGVPVVTTPVGIEGIDAVDGESVLLADDPSSFAASVADLIESPDEGARIGRAGQRVIDALCGEAAVRRALDELLAALGVHADAGPTRPASATAWRTALRAAATWRRLRRTTRGLTP